LLLAGLGPFLLRRLPVRLTRLTRLTGLLAPLGLTRLAGRRILLAPLRLTGLAGRILLAPLLLRRRRRISPLLGRLRLRVGSPLLSGSGTAGCLLATPLLGGIVASLPGTRGVVRSVRAAHLLASTRIVIHTVAPA